MQNLIKEKINILKKTNKFNLDSITKEEIGEFREARENYIKAVTWTDDKKYIQRKFEAMLDEIADVYVVTDQWNDPVGTRKELLTVQENVYIYDLMEDIDINRYVEAVMLYKMQRTFLRNRVDWYKK